jgi:hypothetical protein
MHTLEPEAQAKLDTRRDRGETMLAVTWAPYVPEGDDRESAAADAISDILTAVFGPAGVRIPKTTEDGTPYVSVMYDTEAGAMLGRALRSYEGDHEDYTVPPDETVPARLEELRAALRAENISYGELADLQGLAPYIADDDVELLEAAGVPEFADDVADKREEDGRVLDALAEYLRTNPQWNGGDFCELAATLIDGTGRRIGDGAGGI